MKYLIKLHASVEAGNRIEAAGGPGPFFNYLYERLRPEAAYGTPTERTCWLVADIDDPATIGEVMLVTAQNVGNEPTFTPVYSLKDFGPIITKALEGVKKAPKVG